MDIGINLPFLKENIDAAMRRNYDNQKVTGAIVRVMRNGETVYEHAKGYADLELQTPVTPQTIYRMYSMSKPVTMTALMTLYERGLVFPEDRLEDFFPAVKDMPVAVEQPDGTVTLEKQASPITVKQLYTMTSGVAYPGDDNAGARSVLKAMDEHMRETNSLEGYLNCLAKHAALSFQPGTRWMYGFSHDVIGALIEKVSGMTFGEYLRRTIFDPLGMPDTGFYVPTAKHARFVTAYDVTDGAPKSMAGDKEITAEYLSHPGFESGGGGLVSTLDDYSRFTNMLLRGGELDGARILGRKTVEMMSTNQLSPELMNSFSWRERGYGYGVGMRTHLTPWVINGSAGEFGWDGMMGTWMAVDPAEGLTVVYLQNMFPYSNLGMRLMPMIYASLE